MAEPSIVTLRPVDADNWRAVAALTVSQRQQAWVAQPSYYLALCAYSPTGWRPLAVLDAGGVVVGFLMWTVDPQDGAAWLGGIIVDQEKQGRGYGRAAVGAAIEARRHPPGATLRESGLHRPGLAATRTGSRQGSGGAGFRRCAGRHGRPARRARC